MRKLFLISLSILCFMLFTACGGSSDGSKATNEKDPITVSVYEKIDYPADIMNGRYAPFCEINLHVTNNTDKPIQGIQGELTAKDLFGELIIVIDWDITGQIIQPGATVDYTGYGMEINEYIDEQQKLFATAFEDMQFSYKESKIVYADETATNEEPSVAEQNKITVAVYDKVNYEEDMFNGRYSPFCEIKMHVTNNTDKPIQGIQGILTTYDLFGEMIIESSYDITGQTIQPGATIDFTDYGLEINNFIYEENKLFSTAFADLKFVYEPLEIVYSDGSKDSFE